MISSNNRIYPNILITGTPGVGKSTLCNVLSATIDLPWLEVTRISRENNFLVEYDTIYRCAVLDEDKVLDYLEPKMNIGGNIVDYHSCEFFPEKWFDLVYVLTADTKPLFDRLERRLYSKRKLKDTIKSEILQIILVEAFESFNNDRVHVLQNNNKIQLEQNLQKICTWIKNWKPKENKM